MTSLRYRLKNLMRFLCVQKHILDVLLLPFKCGSKTAPHLVSRHFCNFLEVIYRKYLLARGIVEAVSERQQTL